MRDRKVRMWATARLITDENRNSERPEVCDGQMEGVTGVSI